MSLTATVSATLTASATVALVPADSSTLRAFPNPASRQVRFHVPMAEPGEVKIHLFNATGERVAMLSGAGSAGLAEIIWDCGQVAPGVYLAVVDTNHERKKFKIAVAR